jgi:hypothetical protein
MANKVYTEEDIQNYADGNFSGDLEDFRIFIEQNPEARKSLEMYEQLFVQFSQPQEPVDIPHNLADQVIASIQARQSKEEGRAEKYLEAGLAFILLTGLVLSVIMGPDFKFLSNDVLSGSLAALVMGLLVWIFAKVELEGKRKIYQ